MLLVFPCPGPGHAWQARLLGSFLSRGDAAGAATGCQRLCLELDLVWPGPGAQFALPGGARESPAKSPGLGSIPLTLKG